MKMPTIFVSHGMPTIALQTGPTHRFFKKLGGILNRPEAIICISAHWEAASPMLTSSECPKTIHDFSGFPKALHEIQYTAPGEPELARRIVAVLEKRDMKARVDPSRGLDHGVWVPLSLMYPNADVPVLQLSVQTELTPAHHFQLGGILRPLREEGVLIIGSGGATHNLPEIRGNAEDADPLDYALAFDAWLDDKVTHGQTDALLDYQGEGPEASRNHPYPAEHFLPLFVPLGAAGEGVHGKRLHTSFMYGVLSMAAYAWD